MASFDLGGGDEIPGKSFTSLDFSVESSDSTAAKLANLTISWKARFQRCACTYVHTRGIPLRFQPILSSINPDPFVRRGSRVHAMVLILPLAYLWSVCLQFTLCGNDDQFTVAKAWGQDELWLAWLTATHEALHARKFDRQVKAATGRWSRTGTPNSMFHILLGERNFTGSTWPA